MKKTLTITTVRAQNYGAVLQAYALHKKILMLGGDNELIYLKNEKTSYFENLKGHRIRTKCIKILENYFRVYRYFESKKGFNRFIEFSEKNFKKTKEIMNLTELDLQAYDAIITGSDQMFGFGVNENINKARFLYLEKKINIKKYSFAASFSSYTLPESQLSFMKTQLQNFDSVSVRETQGQVFLIEKLGINSHVNIDPVFLLSSKEWEEIISNERIIKEKYILCYFLINSPMLQKILDNLKKKYNYPIIAVQLTAVKRVKADKYIFDAGPKEFLNLIKNAEIVVTTSFHGTAFSIIFEKEFYSILREGYRTERFESLLTKLNINKRLISKDDNLKDIPPIDYELVRKLIENEKTKSNEYLLQILK